MKRIIYTTVDDFLRDDDFIRYVMDACPEKEAYWVSYQSAAPKIRAAYQKAYEILKHLDDCSLLSAEEIYRLKQRVMHTISITVN